MKGLFNIKKKCTILNFQCSIVNKESASILKKYKKCEIENI